MIETFCFPSTGKHCEGSDSSPDGRVCISGLFFSLKVLGYFWNLLVFLVLHLTFTCNAHLGICTVTSCTYLVRLKARHTIQTHFPLS